MRRVRGVCARERQVSLQFVHVHAGHECVEQSGVHLTISVFRLRMLHWFNIRTIVLQDITYLHCIRQILFVRLFKLFNFKRNYVVNINTSSAIQILIEAASSACN